MPRVLLAVAVLLYFFGLTRAGLISANEPRYASVAHLSVAFLAFFYWILRREFGSLAASLPARRATKVDPMVALRYE